MRLMTDGSFLNSAETCMAVNCFARIYAYPSHCEMNANSGKVGHTTNGTHSIRDMSQPSVICTNHMGSPWLHHGPRAQTRSAQGPCGRSILGVTRSYLAHSVSLSDYIPSGSELKFARQTLVVSVHPTSVFGICRKYICIYIYMYVYRTPVGYAVVQHCLGPP